MSVRRFLLTGLFALSIGLAATAGRVSASDDARAAIETAVASPDRNPKNVARDVYRHPVETLAFFGVTPSQTLVEIWPSAGWYTEILAPLLRDKGTYIAAVQGSGRGREATLALFAKNPQRFDKAIVTTLEVGKPSDIAPPQSADIVLTFRNVHNFLMAGDEAAAQFFDDCYRALKPGGVLGVVDHALPDDAHGALEGQSGYIKRSTIIKLATAAGFVLDGESAINANPKDDHRHPSGVWTLPPNYALKDIDHAKYEAIGESDRVTLRLVKPR
jgi:predicted methyltransferase